jgi:hypothetical protein
VPDDVLPGWDIVDEPANTGILPPLQPSPPAGGHGRAGALAATLFQALVMTPFTFVCMDLQHATGARPWTLAADVCVLVLFTLLPLASGIRRVLHARMGEPMPGRVFLSMVLAGAIGIAVATALWGAFWLTGIDGKAHAFGAYSVRDAVMLAQLCLGMATTCLMLIAFDPVLGRWMTFGSSRPSGTMEQALP